MRLVPTLALIAASTVAHADELRPPRPHTVLAHVRISDTGEYAATVARSGTPTSLWVKTAGQTIEIKLRLDGPGRLHYEVRRVSDRQFILEGEAAPSFGTPATIGHFPASEGGVDVQLWLSNP